MHLLGGACQGGPGRARSFGAVAAAAAVAAEEGTAAEEGGGRARRRRRCRRLPQPPKEADASRPPVPSCRPLVSLCERTRERESEPYHAI